MQNLKHYIDGRVEVSESDGSFNCTFKLESYDALMRAVDYARGLPATDAPEARKPRPQRRARLVPRAAASTAAPAAAASDAPALPVPQLEAKANTAAVSDAIVYALKFRNMTAKELCEDSHVASHISTTQDRIRRSVVASTLTRLVKAGTVANVGDIYKLILKGQ